VRSSYEGSFGAVVNWLPRVCSLMVLTIFIAWLALAALAVFFVYCCSRVSNGAPPADDDFTAQPRQVDAAAVSQPRRGDLYRA
jgi:hypothetical protein